MQSGSTSFCLESRARQQQNFIYDIFVLTTCLLAIQKGIHFKDRNPRLLLSDGVNCILNLRGQLSINVGCTLPHASDHAGEWETPGKSFELVLELL